MKRLLILILLIPILLTGCAQGDIPDPMYFDEIYIEGDSIIDRLDNIDAQLSAIDLEFIHDTLIFPETTGETCTIVSGLVNNTWSDWVEITDGITFSSKILYPTHISQLKIEDASDANEIYMVEISYGDAKTVVARRRFAPSRELGIVGVEQNSLIIPAGEKVYGRAMCSNGGNSVNIVLRYHYQ